MTAEYLQNIIELYGQIAAPAVAIAFVFGMGNLIVSTFLNVAFGGDLRFGGVRYYGK